MSKRLLDSQLRERRKYLKKVFAGLGTQGSVAEKLGEKEGRSVSQQSISQWVSRGQVPAWVCVHILELSGGDVTPHDLRPDIYPETY